ncbi:MAG TPA: protein kinase [Pseudomonadota bacterium]|nr:protein kinase [Pseudomonadota bacterium]
MKINNQLEQPLTAAERPAGADVDMAARRPLYHPAARPRLGRVLRGRYRLESLLGMGAMGEVYRAVDLRLRQPCAVKLVFPGAVFGLKAHRRFDNEARVIARLFHPNIVEVRDFSEDEDGTKFLVMELLEGQDLHQLLSRYGRLPLPRAMEIIRAVGAALQYAHDMGIVHRDIKPENIFLGTRGRLDGPFNDLGEREQIKVLDFGLAKLLSDSTGEERGPDHGEAPAQLTSGIIIGTLAYLSPEATGMDSAGVDARSDQWSLAVVAYQLLSGRLPFGNSHPLGLWQMICREEPVRLRTLVPDLPEYVDTAIHTALAKQPKDRFAKISDFIRSLGNLPQLGSVRTDCGAASAPAESAPAAPAWDSEADPTEVEPYLPGLTRPRLAILPIATVRPRSVPEFVEPDHELHALRIPAGGSVVGATPRREQSAPHPDLLVTAHYTPEQLLELSYLANMGDAPALVHAAQDVPTAPYRIGARSAKDMDEQFDRTPLPVPRPLGAEQSVRLPTAQGCQLTTTLVPTGEPYDDLRSRVFATLRAEPPPPPSEPAVGLATLVELSAAKTEAPAAGASASLPTVQVADPPAVAGRPAGRVTPPRPPAAAFAPPQRRPASSSPAAATFALGHEPARSTPAMPALQMPSLLTLTGTAPPELGIPLPLAVPRLRWPLWRALGAGSVVLGLLVAVLLGLRLARTKAVSSGATLGQPPAQLARFFAVPSVQAAPAGSPRADALDDQREPERPAALTTRIAPPVAQSLAPRPPESQPVMQSLPETDEQEAAESPERVPE